MYRNLCKRIFIQEILFFRGRRQVDEWTKGGWEILIYDQDEIMRATKSGPLLFCSKIPVLVLAPSTGKPPPPSRKASIVLHARGHTAPPPSRHGPAFTLISAPAGNWLSRQAQVKTSRAWATSNPGDSKSRLIRRLPELRDATQKWSLHRLNVRATKGMKWRGR